MDLRTAVAIGAHIDEPFEQLTYGKGYDHNWVLNNNCDINVLAAKAVSAKSGIGLEVYTNEPGIQFYAGNAMTKDGDKGKIGCDLSTSWCFVSGNTTLSRFSQPARLPERSAASGRKIFQ